MRAAINWIFTALVAVLVLPFFQAPAIKLAEATGFDKVLSNKWGPMMTWLAEYLSSLSGNYWYVFGFGIAVGATITLWADIKLKLNTTNRYPKVIAEGGKSFNPSQAPRGGDVDVKGNRSGAQGGNAGTSGRGGDVRIRGEGAYGRGGAGGNLGTTNGRGGRAAIGPMEAENGPTWLWNFGRGGIGGSHPEYARRLATLTEIRKEYMRQFPDEIRFVEAGIEYVPINWVDKRLEELNEPWRVTMGPSGYVLPPLNHDN